MKERPILFSSPMIKAILAGTKTQTRRIVKQELRYIDAKLSWWPNGIVGWTPVWANDPPSLDLKCPYGEEGDQLWVRETWNVKGLAFGMKPSKTAFASKDAWRYKATDDGSWKHGWKPSIFMPRWASRISLEITNVRFQKLHNISEADAIAEGVIGPREVTMHDAIARNRFEVLWEQINHKRAPWDSNPWVRVIDFKRAT